MPLTLYYHPLSSYCQKALVALYEMGLAFQPHLLDLSDPQVRADFLRLWPTGKMPLLLDDGHPVPESSILIEHLQLRHAPSCRLIPAEPEPALEVRLWDRLLDLYVMTPMQAIVANRHLRAEQDRDPLAVPQSIATLSMAYALLDQRLEGRTWLAGHDFSLAECAAAPSLFYAATLQPIPAERRHLRAYVERLMARPSVARTLDEARPWFKLYPGRDGLPERYRP